MKNSTPRPSGWSFCSRCLAWSSPFAVTVSKTALWIAESQAMQDTETIVHKNSDFLPLKSYTNIVEGNALRMDWNDVVPKEKLDCIMGNPPLDGYNWGHLKTQGFQTIFQRKTPQIYWTHKV